MNDINNFDFSKYDVGANGATAGDAQLTGKEVELAKKDGWTVWDGFQRYDRPLTDESVNAIAKNMKASLTERRSEEENHDEAQKMLEDIASEQPEDTVNAIKAQIENLKSMLKNKGQKDNSNDTSTGNHLEVLDNGIALDNNVISNLSKKSGLKFVSSMLDSFGKLGRTLPTDELLNAQGFNSVYMTDKNEAHFYENMQGGKLRICDKEGEGATGKKGSKRVQYTGSRYDEDFIYDSNGKLQKGSITIKDEKGELKEKYDFEIGADGKMTLIH